MREPLPHLRESLPDLRETLPSLREILPNLRESLPSSRAWPLLAGKRLRILNRPERGALGIGVRLHPARQRVRDGDRRLEVREPAREEPEAPAGPATVDHLEDPFDVRSREEPEGSGRGVELRHRTLAGLAGRPLPVDRHLETVPGKAGRRARADLGRRPHRKLLRVTGESAGAVGSNAEKVERLRL